VDVAERAVGGVVTGGRLQTARALTVLALLLTLGGIAACGVTPEAQPQRVTTGPDPASLPPAPTTTGIVQVYLVRGERLVGVDRAGDTATDALALLAAGPTTLDGDAGLTTALPPAAIGRAERQDAGIVTVEVSAELAALPARRQLLAVAQLVWTVTGVCCEARLRILRAGQPLTVVTDSGPANRPVGRDDYRSVAP
jgi:hypothetical protein